LHDISGHCPGVGAAVGQRRGDDGAGGEVGGGAGAEDEGDGGGGCGCPGEGEGGGAGGEGGVACWRDVEGVF